MLLCLLPEQSWRRDFYRIRLRRVSYIFGKPLSGFVLFFFGVEKKYSVYQSVEYLNVEYHWTVNCLPFYLKIHVTDGYFRIQLRAAITYSFPFHELCTLTMLYLKGWPFILCFYILELTAYNQIRYCSILPRTLLTNITLFHIFWTYV